MVKSHHVAQPIVRAVSELVIIVIGVLIALAVDSWRESVNERRLESQYLLQILSDSRANDSILRVALGEEELRQRDLTAIYRAIGADSVAPDSVSAWFGRLPSNYSDPRLQLGSLTALVGTGEIRLVRSPELRSALVAYVSQIEMDLAEIHRWVDMLPAVYDRESRIAHENRLPVDAWRLERRSERMARAFSARRAHDAELANVYDAYMQSVGNRVIYYQRMTEATSELIAILEAGE